MVLKAVLKPMRHFIKSKDFMVQFLHNGKPELILASQSDPIHPVSRLILPQMGEIVTAFIRLEGQENLYEKEDILEIIAIGVHSDKVEYGFGCDEESDDYIVVKYVETYYDDLDAESYVYRRILNQWIHGCSGSYLFSGKATFTNGVFYWLAREPCCWDIFMFDWKNMTWTSFNVPEFDEALQPHAYGMCLKGFGGQLYLHVSWDYIVELWLFHPDGNQPTWTRALHGFILGEFIYGRLDNLEIMYAFEGEDVMFLFGSSLYKYHTSDTDWENVIIGIRSVRLLRFNVFQWHHIDDVHRFEILDSHRGVVCMKVSYPSMLIFFNPATRGFRILENIFISLRRLHCYGFGYDETKKFVIVKYIGSYTIGEVGTLWIFDWETQVWELRCECAFKLQERHEVTDLHQIEEDLGVEVTTYTESTSEEHSTATLTIRSSDDHEFVISESAAVLSETIKSLVEDGCAGNVIPLPNVDGKTLAKIITYLNKHADEAVSGEEKKRFDDEFFTGEEMNTIIFDVVLAANYLDIKNLFAMTTQKIADKIANKSVNYVRKLFGVENDFTPEEEQEIREKHAYAWEGVDPDEEDVN
ncbi:hypothetical protein BUALT_Bualt06G0025700 [Buddleja alternifolia]|uniref:SKP1-like protein n=1 Tax=Buddleja alternifolia TaxID=168488 RepID=A0AAV6XNA2_9LAMI|nr:hypothetical protein BUALT_Bualt06G0025700 [Buddleja alternifolia]